MGASSFVEELYADLHQFGAVRAKNVNALVRSTPRKPPFPHPTSLILALGDVETHLRNIVGDGGHGRGWLQIDDRSSPGWLKSQKGCLSGQWAQCSRHHDALRPGHVPELHVATMRALAILHENYTYLTAHISDMEMTLRATVSSYNAGAGGALNGVREAQDPDRHTTGGKYSKLVLERVQPVYDYGHAQAWW